MTDRVEPLSRANWPSESQVLLARAAASDDGAAVDAWREWRRRSALDSIDFGSFALLPSVYQRLQQVGHDDPDMPRIRGIYKQSWLRNSLLLRGFGEFTKNMDESGVPFLAIKGVPLLLRAYGDIGARALVDFDAAVQWPDFERSVAVLHRHGWAGGTTRTMPERLWRYQHAHTLYRDPTVGVDLHHRIITHEIIESFEAEIHDRAVDDVYRGLSYRTPDPTDTVIAICYHARQGDPQSAGRWLVDLGRLDGGTPIDWDALLARIESAGIVFPVRDALTFAHARGFVALPKGFLEAAWRAPVAGREGASYRRLVTRPNPRRWWVSASTVGLWPIHRALERRGRWRAAMTFPGLVVDWYQWRFGVARRSDLPKVLVRELRVRRQALRAGPFPTGEGADLRSPAAREGRE